MYRYLFTVQYLGTRYAGWQTQKNATGVQQVIEAALSKLCASEIKIESSGRTDAGVHARGMRAHADVTIPIESRGLILGLNDLLPHDIRIMAAEKVRENFHARFDAVDKTYVYQIWNDNVCDVFHHETFAHVPGPLEADLMAQAAEPLAGHHDFRRFTVAEPEVTSTWRTISRIGVHRDGREVFITVAANGFLRYMVRRIAGSLIQVGRGKLGVKDVIRSVEPELAIARWTAPANGLVLDHVSYGEASA